MVEKITSVWIDCDFAECPECGDCAEVLAMPNGNYFDGSPLRCCGCGLKGWVASDEDGTWDNWDGY